MQNARPAKRLAATALALAALASPAAAQEIADRIWSGGHRDRTVGPIAADNISPTGWVTARGMKFSSHHDAPVAFPDSMRILDATVTRRSRSGDIIGPAHRVDVITALKAMTIWPAWQHFEDESKGSIEVGKLADLVILSADPTAVDPETLDQLRIEETIKEGETIYAADEDQREGRLRPMRDGDDAFANFLRRAALAQELPTTGPDWRTRYARSLADGPHDAACLAGFLQAALGPGLAAVR